MSINLKEISRLVEFYNEQATGKSLNDVLKADKTIIAFVSAMVIRINAERGSDIDSWAAALTKAITIGIFLGEIGKTQLLNMERLVH